MSGFYGNAYAGTGGLQIDKRYENRKQMDANASSDGVFVNRYVLVDYDNNSTSYKENYDADAAVYAFGDRRFRGYDSTVWQKVYDNGYKYVAVGDLNGLMPVISLKIDAPSEQPQKPYFDNTGTNISYNLHLQPNWGIRIAEKKSTDNHLSDVDGLAISFNADAFDPRTAPISIYKSSNSYYLWGKTASTANKITPVKNTIYRVYDGKNATMYTLKYLEDSLAIFVYLCPLHFHIWMRGFFFSPLDVHLTFFSGLLNFKVSLITFVQ